MKSNVRLNKQLDANTFASTLGQAIFLMSLSDKHKNLPIKIIEKRILPAIFLRHFKLYLKEKQPIAFITWASVSDNLKTKMSVEHVDLDLNEWRSGNNLIVVDCISPFNPPETFEQRFFEQVKKDKAP